MDNFQSEMVIEELRLKVPADVKAAWLNAEKEVWEPWLSSQDGFLGRQLSVSYTHLRAHETDSYLVCRLLLEKKISKILFIINLLSSFNFSI